MSYQPVSLTPSIRTSTDQDHDSETQLVRRYAQKWYRKTWEEKIKKEAEISYQSLRLGADWNNPNFDQTSMQSLSNTNLLKLRKHASRLIKALRLEEQVLENFLTQFSQLSFIANAHIKQSHPISVIKSLTKRLHTTQSEISRDPSSVLSQTNAELSDIQRLANNSFVFFKLQLDPETYPSIRYHRSNLGRQAHVFPLENTHLLKFGHVYTIDPVWLDGDGVDSDFFQDTIVYQHLPPEETLREPIDEETYAYSNERQVAAKPLEKIFYGKDILQGIALYMLTESCRLHPKIVQTLLDHHLSDPQVIKLMDILLSRVLKIQGLLPGEIGTGFTKFIEIHSGIQ